LWGYGKATTGITRSWMTTMGTTRSWMTLTTHNGEDAEWLEGEVKELPLTKLGG